MPRTDDYDPLMDELPPELAAEYRKEKRRQRISESMLQQSMQPITGEGRHSPLQGIAKLVQAYMGSRGMDEGDSRLADIGARGAQGRQEAYGAMTRAMQGTPEQVQELPADVMGPPQITPAVPGGPDAMIQAGMNSPYTQKIAQAMMLEKMKAQMKQPDRIVVPSGASVWEGGKSVFTAPHKPSLEHKTTLEKLIAARDALPVGDPSRATYDTAIKKESEWRPSSTVNVAAPVTPVTIQDPENPNATIIIDGRTKNVLGKGPKLSQVGSSQEKLVLKLPQAKLRTESIVQNLDALDAAMTNLHDNPDLSRITGTIMGRTPNITNEATGVQTDLNSIKSKIFQSSLQAMREASKTGGAVGNVSDKEGDKLERTLAGLDQSAGTPKFKENLKNAIAQVRASKEIIKNAFDEEYGGIISSKAIGNAGSGSSAVDAALEKYK